VYLIVFQTIVSGINNQIFYTENQYQKELPSPKFILEACSLVNKYFTKIAEKKGIVYTHVSTKVTGIYKVAKD